MSHLWMLPGQPSAAQALRLAAERGEVSHAWAFVGPPGVGQEQAARALAAALNCPSAGCGVCGVCRRCVGGAFPSLWEFAPSGAAHRVADVRERWLPSASHSAVEGSWKVLRVVDAERMNEAAANAFLKALEEPPPRTVWVLDVADPDELPDTILSRCRVVRFSPWSLEALRAEAGRLGIDDADQELAARLAQGSPRALARFAEGGLEDVRAHRALPGRLREEGQGVALLAAREVDAELKRRTAAQKAAGKAELERLAELYGDAAPRAVVKQVEERLVREEREARAAALQGVLDDLATWFRDALLLATGGGPEGVLNLDAIGPLRSDAEALGPARLLLAAQLVQRAREGLELNLQQALALEALLLDLAALALPGAPPAPLGAARRR
jgi:DNA polymerase-3 subunit delta'